MDYSSVLDNFSKKKVLVIGDIILDHYINGTTNRISPEAPVPVISYTNEFYSPGGAANVAANLSSLNTDVWLVGRTGRDKESDIISHLLKDINIPKKYMIRVSGYQTPTKTRLISDSQQIVRLDRETIEIVADKTENKVITYIRTIVNKFSPDAIIVSDYNKGLVTGGLIKEINKIAKKNKIIVVVDPKGTDFGKYRGADVITPNQKEAERICGFNISNDKSAGKAIRRIKKITGIENIFITRGKCGTSFMVPGKNPTTVPAIAKEVYDVTGAGDTFISVLTLGLISGLPGEASVNLANSAAGIVIERTGTSTLTSEELVARLKDQNRAKLLSEQAVGNIINSLKSRGKRIVFTNGCFDLFHSGHLDLLQRSGDMGDILVVALNSDRSIKMLKGPERPYISEKERISIISALECVDHVVVFDDLTPIELIKAIKPDIITKGGDYRKEDVVGREVIEKYGGEIRIIPLSKDISTTKIAEVISSNLKNRSKN